MKIRNGASAAEAQERESRARRRRKRFMGEVLGPRNTRNTQKREQAGPATLVYSVCSVGGSSLLKLKTGFAGGHAFADRGPGFLARYIKRIGRGGKRVGKLGGRKDGEKHE